MADTGIGSTILVVISTLAGKFNAVHLLAAIIQLNHNW
jgi:hypothetical protein